MAISGYYLFSDATTDGETYILKHHEEQDQWSLEVNKRMAALDIQNGKTDKIDMFR